MTVTMKAEGYLERIEGGEREKKREALKKRGATTRGSTFSPSGVVVVSEAPRRNGLVNMEF
jgi:hypothetical protein